MYVNSENQTHKTYKRQFDNQILDSEQKDRIKKCMNSIFGTKYEEVDLYCHNQYRLFSLKREMSYTAFNMGAGENAVLAFLPGTVHPEKYLLEEALKEKDIEDKTKSRGAEHIREHLKAAIDAGTHHEFPYLSRQLFQTEDDLFRDVVKIYNETHAEETGRIKSFVADCLARA